MRHLSFWNVRDDLQEGNVCASRCQSPSSRAQNRGFCAFLALGTPVFGRSEHKNGFCVSEWAIFPWFLPLPSTKSGFLCAFACLGHGLQILRSSILPQILCCTAKRKIADSLVVTISDSLRGVTRNRTGDTRIFSPLAATPIRSELLIATNRAIAPYKQFCFTISV